MVSCGMDKTIIYWDVATGQAVRKYRGHLGTVNCVKFNEESTVAVSGSLDTTIRCWDCRSKKLDAFQIMDDGKDSITSVQVSDHEILSGSLDGKIRRYDIRNGRLVSDEMARNYLDNSVILFLKKNCQFNFMSRNRIGYVRMADA